MRFSVRFHGPFRVGTGLAGGGADDTVDRSSPLASSSLKGAMRRAARSVLRLPSALVDDVYGAPGEGSPWSWSDGVVEDRVVVSRRARVALDDDSGTVDDHALAFLEEVWAEAAVFTIDPMSTLERARREVHEVVLVASAHAVHSLGAQRRRGLGWVTVTALDPVLDDGVLSRLHDLRGAG